MEEKFDSAIITKFDFFRLVPENTKKIECTLCEKVINKTRLAKHRLTQEHKLYESDLRTVKLEARIRLEMMKEPTS
jgi:hypothetical protein